MKSEAPRGPHGAVLERCPLPTQARRCGAVHSSHGVGSPASQNCVHNPCHYARFITTGSGFSPVLICGEMLCPILTPDFAEEIYPFLEVFSGRYPSKKTPDYLFSGMHGCRGYGCLVRAGYTWCIDATFLPGLDDYPWPCAVHRSVRATVERVRRFRAMLGGRSREWQE
jgi:hypothetical protein